VNLQSKPKPGSDLLARFAAIVGDKYAITDEQLQQAYLVEMRDLYRGHTPMVLRPGSVAEVAAIVKLANETRTALVPQGGNTGLVGGQIPFNGEIVLSLTRLEKIREVDAISNTMTCEAGVTLQRRPRIGFIRSFCRRRVPARSVAILRPMLAASRRSNTALRVPMHSGWRSCSPTAAS